jgi:polyphosphate kinase 2 (PPK2 family)
MAQTLSLPPGSDVRLADFDADYHEGLDKEDGKAETQRLWEELDDLAYRLYAEARRAVVVVLQGIDAAGKDGTIRSRAASARSASTW